MAYLQTLYAKTSPSQIGYLLFGFLALYLSLGSFGPTVVHGQTPEPVNLSLSGAASNPFLVVDSSGVAHVIWTDEFAGLMYVRAEGEAWSDPIAVSLPFAEQPPLLVADSSNNIHAFWLSEDNELFYSWVAAFDFANEASWLTPQLLSESALAMDAAVEANGRLHLVYIRALDNEDEPAGVYYRRSASNQDEWSTPQLLYQSAYFRAMRQDHAHVRLAVADNGAVFAAWDNRALDVTFVARSTNNGQSWETAREVDQRSRLDIDNAVGPSNTQIVTQGNDVHLIWQAGHGNLTCGLHHQWSANLGQTWEPSYQLGNECFDSVSFLGTHNELLVLMLVRTDGVFLLAWNGNSWSEPSQQQEATMLINPSSYRTVRLSCQQAAVSQESVFIVGCGQTGLSDIWLLERDLSEAEGWFPAPSVWRQPEQITEWDVSITDTINAPKILTEPEGQMHLFWSWPSDSGIYYSFWDGIRWLLRPARILSSPDQGTTDLSVATTRDERLSVVWSDSNSGRLYFSQANSQQAAIASDWLDITELPTHNQFARSPTIVNLADNSLLIVYTIPVNEERGIYMIRSTDYGVTWSEPVQLFDGVTAGWQVVGRAQVAQTSSGSVHVLWQRESLVDAPQGAQQLLYTHSFDRGETWSTPESVIEADVVNALIAGAGSGTVHRVWQQNRNGRISLTHQYSNDNGRSWNRPTVLGGSTTSDSPYTLVVDLSERMHLLRVVDSVLQHWQWDGDQWLANESKLLLPEDAFNTTIVELAATATQDGLTVSYVQIRQVGTNSGTGQNVIINVLGRELADIADIAAAPTLMVLPSLTEAITPVATEIVTPSPTATTIPDFGIDGVQTSSTARLLGSAIGILASAAIVIAVVALSLYGVRRKSVQG